MSPFSWFPARVPHHLRLLLPWLGLWMLLSFRARPTVQTAYSCPPRPCVPGYQVDALFYQEVLEQAGLPVSSMAVQALRHWASYEQSRACWNPLAVARRLPNWYCDYNSVHVQHYPTREMGLQATVETLQLPLYRGLRAFLAGQVFPRHALEQALGYWIRGKTTACGGYCPALLREWAWLWQARRGGGPARCPPGWFRLRVWSLHEPLRDTCVPTLEARWVPTWNTALLFHWQGWVYLRAPEPRIRVLGHEALLLWVDDQRVSSPSLRLTPEWHRVEAWAMAVPEVPGVAVRFSGRGMARRVPVGETREAACPPRPCLPGREVPRAFFVQVLRAADLPVTEFGLRALEAWQSSLQVEACWNPLGLYRNMPAWWCPSDTGPVHYRDPAMGIYATAAALGLPQAQSIRRMLRQEAFDPPALEQALSLWATGHPDRCSRLCQELVQTWGALWRRYARPEEGKSSCRPRGCRRGLAVDREMLAAIVEGLGLQVTEKRMARLLLWQQSASTSACWNPLGLAWDTGLAPCADPTGAWHFADRETGIRATVQALARPEFKALLRYLAGRPVPPSALQEALARWFDEAPWACPRCRSLLQRWQRLEAAPTPEP